MLLVWILIFSFLGSIASIIIASIFLLLKEETQKKIIPCLISFSTGSLLAASFLGLIPHSLKHLSPEIALKTTLVGIVTFFILEKLLLWRHCHEENCEEHKTSGTLILIGDAFHNFIDGIVLGSSFLVSIPLGIAVGFSTMAHEIPQELGDFAILLHNKYSKKEALFWNIVSGSATIPGALLAYYTLGNVKHFVPYIMAFSAASFIYIALSDLVPELHKKATISHTIKQLFFMLGGIILILFVVHSH